MEFAAAGNQREHAKRFHMTEDQDDAGDEGCYQPCDSGPHGEPQRGRRERKAQPEQIIEKAKPEYAVVQEGDGQKRPNR